MKILLVGPFGTAQREEAIARGFRENGAEVDECPYGDLLFSRNILRRLQFRISAGPVHGRLARRVRRAAERSQPDVILFRRPLEFTTAMLRYIKNGSTALFASFNNDDPFSPSYHDRRWKELRAAIPEFDLHFAFRGRNLRQYEAAGAKNVALWEPFYSPWLHRPLTNGDTDTSVLFAMHAEKDQRREAVLALMNAGLDVRVHCWNWKQAFGDQDPVNILPPIWGDEYAIRVGQAMGTLCFFSKQNGDELTSRVFEIPACGGLLIAERTERLQQIFRDGEESILFSDLSELVKRVTTLRNNPTMVKEIKARARMRLVSSRHSVVDRCADAIKVFDRLMPLVEKRSVHGRSAMPQRSSTSERPRRSI